ncbi:glycoside hydrolase family 16 protein [Macroventuria anomochaeta]|uniref:Glycoside hydrolase family 16 protein n=1 Tax=Macroventuria anomochaeta TaxID=301207 RepID=A0ACB6SHZ9_9PLEO|nr:glycoside hydrolase family 16 protein [Macroventuria anomochaeta]KAF2632722.1 glycoside hydrolase family 16 protein [Macroventuria anomochaeta]
MSLKRSIATLPLLWLCATAIPAGSGWWPNGTSSDIVGGDFNTAAYGLIDTYDGTNWLNMFDVQAITDPTHGFVEYVNVQQAQQLGLLRAQGSQVYMGVDTTSVLNPNGPGRKSVRIQSKRAYNQALVIADFAHVPGSNCGSWPAFWMVGPNWPNQGEIDIYEGVHLNTYNQATLHTSPGCVPSVGPGGETGRRVANADCGTGGGFNGCGVESNNPTSYGTAFNANGGGVYAALWTNSGIKIWYFASRDVPANIRNGNPDPSLWGTPAANFGPGCDYGTKFRDLNIVFDITFCGDWAGGTWGQTSCAQVNPSCNAYVASQPQSFADSYWMINSVKVYSV